MVGCASQQPDTFCPVPFHMKRDTCRKATQKRHYNPIKNEAFLSITTCMQCSSKLACFLEASTFRRRPFWGKIDTRYSCKATERRPQVPVEPTQDQSFTPNYCGLCGRGDLVSFLSPPCPAGMASIFAMPGSRRNPYRNCFEGLLSRPSWQTVASISILG